MSAIVPAAKTPAAKVQNPEKSPSATEGPLKVRPEWTEKKKKKKKKTVTGTTPLKLVS